MENKYISGAKMLKIEIPQDSSSVPKSMQLIGRIIERFIHGENVLNDKYKALHLFQLSACFTEDEGYPFNYFNILEHKTVWIEQLKGYMNLHETEEKALKSGILPRSFYRILYQYYMITENAHWISDEARANVQKIHDLQMPSSYFYELLDLINSLEVPEEAKEESDAV